MLDLRLGLWPALICATILLIVAPSSAAELIVNVGRAKTVTTEELLGRPDAATIDVPEDNAYQRAMTYRAVPLRAILGVDSLPADQDLQITAIDGFITNLPPRLIFPPNGKGAEPWLANEPPDKPWPLTPGGKAPGPFYLVWLNPSASGVVSEQWPYQVDAIRSVPSRAALWPQIAVGKDVAAKSPIREGQIVFAKQCMVCHQLNGAGDSTMGPDLNQPRNPTEYFQPWALKALIRKPSSLRRWPGMMMPGFNPTQLGDADLDAVVAYLGYMAHRHR